ncbi:ABC transporter permease [Streptomyces sp. NPDC056937]|uniref:ABC transporter permease n=1 Tax=Streptomyces sp. NPDC056937 TaxID=3345969 RepID=UPI0036317F15
MPEPQSPRPDDNGGAIAATGAGGAMDLATSEGGTLEQQQQRGGPEGGPDGGRGGGPEPGPDARPGGESTGRPHSLWSDAWRDLRRNPVFVLSGLVIVFLVIISIRPSLIAGGNPLSCDLARAQDGSRPGHPFGFNGQGCDVYTRTVHGARTSVVVGVLASLGVAVAGSVLGGLAGFYGGFWDAVLSRVTDIFFGIPVVLGGLVLLSVVTSSTVWPVIGFMVLLGWPQISRIARGSVITVKQNDFVQAARALGASSPRLMLRHILPNAVAPVIVVATIALGTFIALEATLSYLGVGLKPPTVSWGIDISDASPYIRNSPHMLLWPAGALAVTVLAFIMLGDAVRDALDPKLR